MEMSEKKVAVVTGGGTGIGAACVRELAATGFRVGILYRSSHDAANQLLAEIGTRMTRYAAHIRSTDTIGAALAAAEAQYRRIRKDGIRAATPAEVGRLICFLGSDDASYITGQLVVIDGGNTIQEYKGPSELYY